MNDGFIVDCIGGDFRVFCRKEFGLKRGGDFMIFDGFLKFWDDCVVGVFVWGFFFVVGGDKIGVGFFDCVWICVNIFFVLIVFEFWEYI